MSEQGVNHLNFAMELCEIPRRRGLYFLFEHPAGASSWIMASVQRLLKKPGVGTYEGDMCQYDMKQMVKWGELFVTKPPRFMSNSARIGQDVNLKCQGKHRHVE